MINTRLDAPSPTIRSRDALYFRARFLAVPHYLIVVQSTFLVCDSIVLSKGVPIVAPPESHEINGHAIILKSRNNEIWI